MSGGLRVLIVDDERPARARLRRLVTADERVRAAEEAKDGRSAIRALEESSFDVVFLDINMPGVDGFGVIEGVADDHLPPVVFVTAYDQHAVRAFDVHAIDYILKPIDDERVRRAIDRVCQQRESSTEGGGPLDTTSLQEIAAQTRDVLRAVQARQAPLSRLVTQSGARVRLIDVDEALYFRAAGNYVEVHTTDGAPLVMETLTAMGSRLDPQYFVRIHRSVIINLRGVDYFEAAGHGDYEVVMTNGDLLRMSRRYREAVFERTGPP